MPLACDAEVHFVPDMPRTFDVGFVGKLGPAHSERHRVLKAVLSSFETNEYLRFHSPREMGNAYSRSKIVFNKSIGGDLNMRFFEGLASGALLVTDRIGNGLEEIGRDREHYVLYDSIEEALGLIRYYLDHDAEREAIATRGQTLAFSEHTYVSRLETVLSTVQAAREIRAPARTADPRMESLWRSHWLRICGGSPKAITRFLSFRHLTPAIATNLAVALLRGLSRRVKIAVRSARSPHEHRNGR
jgi:hypothetical protein